MTYLSKIPINPRRRSAVRLLANPHAIHAAIQAGIAAQPINERLLWRLETANPHQPILLVLTQSTPDWHHLVDQAGWPDSPHGQALTRSYTPLLAQLAVGREFAFRVTASPVHNTKTPDKLTAAQQAAIESDPDKRRRGFRLGHRTTAQQLGWFLQRTPRAGFTIPQTPTSSTAPQTDADHPPTHDVIISARNTQRFRKKPSNKHPVVLTTATFEGRLRITDTEAIRHTLLNGLGPGKAYGCGLLTLAPLPTRDDANG